MLDSGGLLTENVAILDWIARQSPALKPADELARAHLIEALGFISTEIHQQYGTFFTGGSDEQKANAVQAIQHRTGFLADAMKGDFLFGDMAGVADFYLFVMLLWARKRKIEVAEKLVAYRDRLMELPAVKQAMQDEGML